MRVFAFRTSIPFVLVTLVLFVLGCAPAASPPGARDPNAVRVEVALGSPVLLANGDSTVYAVLRVSTAARPTRERGPVNVALAIDTSGSMEGEAIAAARRASLEVIDALKDGDRLAVVVFHSKAEVLVPSTELDAEVRAEARRRIAAMEARGTTEMAGGLQTALDEVLSNVNPNGVNRVVLLGDGIPNQPANLEYTARRAADRGVAITTLGLGLDYDEMLMGKLADLSGGRYRYIETADKLAGFFREELDRLDLVYGRNAAVALTPGPGVRIDAIVGGETISPGHATAYLPLGDITRGDSRDVVVRMTVTPRKADVPIELLDAVLTFDDALEQAGRLERRLYLGARTTLDEAEVARAKNPAVELSAALAEASATTLQALELGKQGAYLRARGLLEKGAAAALAQSKRTPSAELEKLAANMTSVAKDMPEADRPAPKSHSSGYEYEFSDDSMAAPMPAEAPSVVRKRKEVHQKAVEALH